MPVGTAWTEDEDQQLRKLVEQHGPKRWSLISQTLKTKGSKQCRRRWKNYLNAEIKKGGWSPEEDAILMKGHAMYGNKWTEIAKMVTGRTDNAVKNRWMAISKKGGGDDMAMDDDDDDEDEDDKKEEDDKTKAKKLINVPSSAHIHGVRQQCRMLSVTDSPGTPKVVSHPRLDSDSDSTPRRGPRPGLNVCIPQAAGEAPAAQGYEPGPMSIRVLKDALDPTELALVQEINDMGMPLTIQVDQSLADAGISCGQQQGGGRLGITPNSYGPGAYKQAQEAMGSPASDQFNIDDLLKYFTGTPTPKQAMQTSRFKPQQLHIPQSGASSLPPTPGTLLDPHRQLLHKLFHKGMQGATPRGSASQTSQKPPTGLNLQLVPQNQLSTLSGLGTPGIRAAAVDLGLDEVSEAVDVLLSPSFNDDDLSALLEALEGGDSGGGSFHTGFTPRGVMRTGLTPKAERQAKRSRIS